MTEFSVNHFQHEKDIELSHMNVMDELFESVCQLLFFAANFYYTGQSHRQGVCIGSVCTPSRAAREKWTSKT